MRKHSKTLLHVLLLVIAASYLGGCDPTQFPFSDNFSDPSTKSKYNIIDERLTDSYEWANERLEMTVHENQDLWGKPMGGEHDVKRGAPLVLIDAPTGSYEVKAKVTATNPDSPGGPQAVNTQVGLFVFWDMENWVFFGFTNMDFTDLDENTILDGLTTVKTDNGSSEIANHYAVGNKDSLVLRVRGGETMSGNRSFEFAYRAENDEEWIIHSTLQLPRAHLGVAEVGMGVKTFDFRDTLTSNVSNEGLGLFDNFQVDIR